MNEIDLGYGALIGIASISVAATVIAMLVVRRWSDQDGVSRAKAQANAHLFELRLFMDDPAQILRSQRALVVDQLRLMKLLLKPLVILCLPMALVMWILDSLYSRAPLRVGEATVISVGARQHSITTPDSVAVETKPVFITSTEETSWRIRPRQPVSGAVRVAGMQATLVSGSGTAFLPRPLMRHVGIRIEYPSATVFGFHWILWFMLLSLITALVLRGPMRVVF